MFHRWEYADQLTLLMWDWNDGVLSRMTPRLLTWAKGETEELSLAREKLLTLDNVNFTIDLYDDKGRALRPKCSPISVLNHGFFNILSGATE